MSTTKTAFTTPESDQAPEVDQFIELLLVAANRIRGQPKLMKHLHATSRGDSPPS